MFYFNQESFPCLGNSDCQTYLVLAQCGSWDYVYEITEVELLQNSIAGDIPDFSQRIFLCLCAVM